MCDYLLRGKLVCLGGDRCAIGRVANIETVDDKSGFDKLDNDFSINLALCPDPLSGLQPGAANRIANYNAAVANKQGELIKEQPGMPVPRESPGSDQPSDRYAGTFVKIHTMLTLDNPIPEDIANKSIRPPGTCRSSTPRSRATARRSSAPPPMPSGARSTTRSARSR